MIRPARDDDLQGLQDVERAAGAPFREFGMGEVADDTPPTVAELAAFARDGRAWVGTDHADKPVAYLLVEAVDGDAHIEQVSVHPDYAHRRMGKSLMDVAAAWAQQHGMAASTLTTYAEVPWSDPCYQRLRFRVVPANELGDGYTSSARWNHRSSCSRPSNETVDVCRAIRICIRCLSSARHVDRKILASLGLDRFDPLGREWGSVGEVVLFQRLGQVGEGRSPSSVGWVKV